MKQIRQYDKIYKKAVNAGLDPLQDPVGAWLANRVSVWGLSLEICILLAILYNPILYFIMIPLAAGFFISAKHLADYNNESAFPAIIMGLVLAPFMGPIALATFLGMLRLSKQ